MLFEGLDRLKRSTIMLAIIMMFVGMGLLMVPGDYVPFLSGLVGFAFSVIAVVSMLTFAESSKSLISYIKLFLGMVIGILGIMLYLVDGAFLMSLGVLVVLIPSLLGILGIIHAFMFARRSGRRGWWMLVVFSCLLLVFGLFTLFNPWYGDVGGTIKVIGGTLMYSALVTALSLVWIWPFRYEEEE